jgi:hypothetical protein
MRNADSILISNQEETVSHWRPRYRWQGNIKIDIVREIECGVYCINFDEDGDHRQALVNTVVNLRAPEHAVYISTS